MMLKTLFVLLVAAAAAGPVQAQVIEIDTGGSAQTYDRPTVFLGDQAAPIRPTVRKSRAAVVSAEAIAGMALAHGLDPALLQAVAWRESRGRVGAVSVKGALGVMQLMPGTAAELNVDPTDALDNVRGGALYLRRQLDRFGGNVPLALAAYNAGPGAVMRYGGIPPYRETQNYVSAILGRWQRPAAVQTLTTLTTEVAQ